MATLIGTVVLVIGAVTAALYGRKANVNLEGEAHLRPDGGVVIVVKASVNAQGVRHIRIATEEGHEPTITVTEILDDGPEDQPLHPGASWKDADAFADEEEVGGGETVGKVVLFHQPVPTSNLVGWRVTSFVDVPRLFKSWRGWWTWAADAFVEIPVLGGRQNP